jgi:hypothetical protein
MSRKTRCFFLLLIVLQCSSLPGLRAQVQLSAKTDVQQIQVGDPLHYFITASADTTKSTIRWAAYPDTFNNLEITERGKIDTVRNGATLTFKQRLLITGFDSGSFLIPRFVFLSENRDGTRDSLFTDSFRLLVNTVPVDTNKPFKGIKGVVTVETSWLDNLPLIIGLLVAIGIIAWVAVYFARNRKVAAEKQGPKAETYHERAVRLLNELDQKQLWQQDKTKEYYTELSETIRQYIEHRFQTNAMELTTEELLHKAKKHKEMAVFRKSLKPLLQAADLAKFAKANPMPEEHIEALQLARDFVRISKPQEEPLSDNPNK